MASAARELRYPGTTYGNLAYELDREVRERELRHAGEIRKPAASAAPQVKSISRVQTRERLHVSPLAVAGFAAVVAMAILVLMSYIQLTEISTSVVELDSQLKTLQTENVTLTAQYQQMYDLSSVKEAAENAGMTKPGSSRSTILTSPTGTARWSISRGIRRSEQAPDDELNHGFTLWWNISNRPRHRIQRSAGSKKGASYSPLWHFAEMLFRRRAESARILGGENTWQTGREERATRRGGQIRWSGAARF